MEYKLLLAQTRVQVTAEGRIGVDRRLHFGVEKAQGVATGGFGLVHGQVGLLQHLAYAVLEAVDGRDTNAGCGVVLMSAQIEGLAQLG